MDETLIRNPKYMQRIKNFSGLQFGRGYPTDIDGFMEFNDKTYILLETKYNGASMPYGQRLAIQRLIDLIEETGRKSIALVAEYTNEEGDIDCGKAMVTEYRVNHVWKIPSAPVSVRDAIDRFLAFATDIAEPRVS